MEEEMVVSTELYELLLHLDFQILLGKIQSMLLGRSLYFLFSRLGWCAGGLCIAVICALFDLASN